MRRANLLGALTVVLALIFGLVTPADRASSGAVFDPGLIISDELFYDGQAMSAGEIQSVLDTKIGPCANGKCLNVATLPVESRPAQTSARTGALICAAIQGGNLRVSELIYRVQVACSISAKVILVTLQKEQGLVTSRAPSDFALRAAMGMGCPDTAPCSSAFAGLATQIITGSAQLMTYKAGRFARQPGVHNILFHPDAACGATSVNIRNFATAALYNYTPYQPNAASLANPYRVGDSCSSYGNRNFWLYYTDWFGSTTGPQLPPTNELPFVLGRDSSGVLWLYSANGSGGWLPRVRVGQDWNQMISIAIAGDADGDALRDVFALDGNGQLWLYPTDGRAGWRSRTLVNSGWNAVRTIVAPGDLTGDDREDLIAIDSSGNMALYETDGRGGLGPARSLGGGWQSSTSVLGAGDFDGDGRADLMSVDGAGRLFLHSGLGAGTLRAPRQIGTDWNTMTAITGIRDFNGDGAVDLLARDRAGLLWLYRGNGAGSWLGRSQVGSGWNVMTAIIGSGNRGERSTLRPGLGDLNGDGLRDVVALDQSGRLWAYPGDGSGGLRSRSEVPGAWVGTRWLFGVNDFDSDGVQDVASVDAAGNMRLHSIQGGSLGTGRQIGSGWGGMVNVFSPGDFDGDRIADILAADAAGALWLYSGNGAGGVSRRQVGTGWNTMTAVVGVGDFNGDRFADVLARDASGVFWMYRGDGSGGWLGRGQVGSGWNKFDLIFASGDVTGDGFVDVYAREPNGALWIYPGNGRGGWKAWSNTGQDWNGMQRLY